MLAKYTSGIMLVEPWREQTRVVKIFTPLSAGSLQGNTDRFHWGYTFLEICRQIRNVREENTFDEDRIFCNAILNTRRAQKKKIQHSQLNRKYSSSFLSEKKIAQYKF